MKISEASQAESSVVGTMRDGVLEQKFLLTGEDGTPNNYLLNVGRTGAGGWTTPRHRHNFDQIRFVIKGEFPYAKGKVLPEGWVGYFPEGVSYGPQDRPEGLEMMVVQFGGASGSGYLSASEREAANDILKKKGEFKSGIFTYYENGTKYNQDGFEACYEQATGKKMVYPKPRYEDLVLMDPSSAEYIADAESGVATKWLGFFTERQTRIGFTRIEGGSTWTAGQLPQIELLFLSKGRVTVEGKQYGPQTAIETRPGDGPISIKAAETSEFLRIVLPKF